MSTTTSTIKKDIETLKARIDSFQTVFAEAVDIHQRTRIIGDYYKSFTMIDAQYKLSNTTQSLESVIQQILSRCPDALKKNITTVLNTIRNTPGVDNETQANLQTLLIKTWSLVNMPKNHSNAFDLLIQNLDHNIATGGGCVPGIAARLIQPYTHFVLKMLENKAADISVDDCDRALQAALRISTAEALEKKQQQAQAAEQFNKALILSKQTTRKTDAEIADDLQMAEILRISTQDF